MQKLGIFFLLLWAFTVNIASTANAAATLPAESVPTALAEWREWILQQYPEQACPLHLASQVREPQRLCQWANQLVIHIDAGQAHFTQTWHVYRDSWVTLPGGRQARQPLWVQDVKLDAMPVTVVERHNVPQVFVKTGTHTLTGSILGIGATLPKYLPIPAQTGLIELHIDGKKIPFPQLDTQGRLWLQQAQSTDTTPTTQDRLTLHVYRKVIDTIPLQVITQIELDVAGRHREVLLGPVLLEKHVPMALTSATLPARLEPDGRLRVQVRPGSWQLNLRSRQRGNVETIQRAAAQADSQWVEQEVWVFEARNALRLVDIQGVTAIDPQQTTLPSDWRQYPAYLLAPDEVFTLVTQRRGDPEPEPDQLRLERHWWLDFDGKGYSVQDHIEGTMTRGWRLEMADSALAKRDTPFSAQLGRVSVNGTDQLITRLDDDNDNDNMGVEVRRGSISLIADSRLAQATKELPVIGWQHPSGETQIFYEVSALLNLPPGWSLLAANGADEVPSTWLTRWSLLDVFIVLVLTMAMSKLWSWRWGLLTFITLVLVFHTSEGLPWLWVNLLISMGLLRVLPNMNWFTWLVKIYRNIVLVGFVVVVVSFSVITVQKSLYPQLAQPWHNIAGDNTVTYESTPTMFALEEDTTMQAPKMMARPAAPQSEQHDYGSFSISSIRQAKRKQLMQIDPNAKVQTGPGLPQWHWQELRFAWHGAVASDHTLRLWLLSPQYNLILGFVKVLLLLIMTVFFLWMAWGQGTRKWLQNTAKSTQATSATATGLLLLLSSSMLLPWSQPVQAEEAFPPQYLLDSYRERLLAPPECLPGCVSAPRMQVNVSLNDLKAKLEVHADTDVAVPLPGTAKQWLPQMVWVHGNPATAIQRDDKGVLWLSLPKGIHQIDLVGAIPKQQNFQLPLHALHPHHVSLVTHGWQVDGLHSNGVSEAQLQFSREQDEDKPSETLTMGSLPSFVEVQRTLRLGLDWQVETRIKRLTPKGSAVVMSIPLLAGESVTSDNVRVEDGHVLLNLAASQTELSWSSVFDKTDQITLTAPNLPNSTEVWRLDASAIWHVDIEGIPVIHHQRDGQWLPEWRPWPGESVTLTLTRPSAVAGQVLTIDRSHLRFIPGQRHSDSHLSLRLRSSRGAQHHITLPDDAQLLGVTINGKSQPIRQIGNRVTLPIVPGEQTIEIQFRQERGLIGKLMTPEINLNSVSVNAHISVEMPTHRWVLLLGGDAIGPAVMFWGVLIVVLLLAITLGQIKFTPLRIWHWFFLLIALSQVSVYAGLVVVAWFIALGWRGQLDVDKTSTEKFNATQVLLVFLSFIALSILIAAVKQGLLGAPIMHIGGNGSTAYDLHWYQDRIDATYPQVWLFSLPILVYRVLMLLWALWLAAAMMHWLRWGWDCFSRETLWKKWQRKQPSRGETKPVAPSAPVTKPTVKSKR